MHKIVTATVALAATVLFAGCSSSGGGGGSVSTSQLEAKLKNEPQLKTVLSQGGLSSSVANKLVDCIAQAIQKDGDPSKVKQYVDGKISINDLGGKSGASGKEAENDAATCAKSVIQQASSSPAG